MRIREQRRSKNGALQIRRPPARKRSALIARLQVENLEPRSLMAVSAAGGFNGSRVEIEANDTVDRAQELGDLSIQPWVAVAGTVGDGPAGDADVDWYRFTLDGPAHVSLGLEGRGSDQPLSGILSLHDGDPNDFLDYYTPYGHRLLARSEGGDGTSPRIELDLGPGTYEVAVSGAGNRDFHPSLAGSGYAGETGDYVLDLDADALDFGPADGPAVLAADPAPNAVLDRSPLVIRLGFGSMLDPSTVIPGQTVRLIYSPNGIFGDGDDRDAALSWTNVGGGGTELQLTPASPLGPGWYQVVLAGDATAAAPVVTDLIGNPLYANESNPQGRDYATTFRVAGIEGNTSQGAASNETAAGAHDLGDLDVDTGLVRVTGVIGDDPFYDNSDPLLNPGNEADLYHFRITGPGRYAFAAEVFAGRIGSPLDPGISLYRLGPDGLLHFLAGNNNTGNNEIATDFTSPLSLDSLLTQGLTEGDYYLVVAGGYNTPSPDENIPLDTPGLFDPKIAHSGQNGFSTGPYVLNLLVYPAPDPPRVVSTSLAEGTTLDQPLTYLTLEFTAPVNLWQLGFQSYNETSRCTIPAVFIVGSDGTKYYPRIDSYDPATNKYTFLMLDRLPGGAFTLHLSGPLGLSDLGGNPLPGNDPSGDFVVHFTVAAANTVRDTSNEPDYPIDAQLDSDGIQILGFQPGIAAEDAHVPSNEPGYVIDAQLDPDGIQVLGILFPRELEGGIAVDHAPTPDAGNAGDGIEHQYWFSLLQAQNYGFTLRGADLPEGAYITLWDAAGNYIQITSSDDRTTLFGSLAPGTYYVEVHGVASDTAYRLLINMYANADNPVPLVTGPAPALQLRFDRNTPPGDPAPPGEPDGSSPINPNPSPPGAPAPPGNGGVGPGAPYGPSPYIPGGPSGRTTLPEQGGTATVVPQVILHPPAIDSGPSLAGAEQGPSTIGSSAAAASAGRADTSISNAAAANISTTDFAVLGVGPVGGVQQTGGGAAATHSVQVALEMPTNTPVPMALVSLMTLTRLGDVGVVDEAGPADRDAGETDVVTAGSTTTADVAAQTTMAMTQTPTLDDPAHRSAVPPDELATETTDAVADAVPATPIVAAEGTGGGEVLVEDAGIGALGALATVNGPWSFFLVGLAAVTVTLRRRWQARRAAAWQRGNDDHSARTLFRLWSFRTSRKVPHALRGRQGRATPSARSNACPQPRHLNNP